MPRAVDRFGEKRRAATRRQWPGVRTALAAAGLVLGMTAAVALVWPRAATGQTDFAQPTEVRSESGVLRATLTAEERAIELGGQQIMARVYNGAFVGSTLRARPGERIELELVNRLTQPTNLHFHGLHVSPGGESDNVFRVVNPGETARYVLDLPADHPAGTFWYHSHQHPLSEEQVFGGMSGMIVIDGLRDQLPPDLRGIEERLFTLKDFQVEDGGIRKEDSPGRPTTRTVNGQINPTLTIAPGETQLWRFANVGAEIYYQLRLDGHAFNVVAEDGSPVWDVANADALVLPPGKRFDVLVQGGAAGSYAFKTIPYDQGSHDFPDAVLATLTVAGTAQPPAPLPASVAPDRDLDSAPIAASRDITFSDATVNDRDVFYINGQQFDHDRVDARVKLGTVEEWTIHNVSDQQHPFHLHINDVQVISVNGQPYDANGLQDIVNLPAAGEVVVRVPFDDFTGKFVFHCHILFHEDNGMMAVVEVTD